MADNRKLLAGLLNLPRSAQADLAQQAEDYERFKQADYLRKMGNTGMGLAKSVARGVPQMATGLVDLAAMPFEAAGIVQPGQAVGSTKWLESKGYLPESQEGFLNQTAELLSGGFDPSDLATKGLPLLAGIGKTVWHGSPHSFEKFDLSKIGTGEGAQAYGHGLYLADARPTAEEYAAMNSPFAAAGLKGPPATVAALAKIDSGGKNPAQFLKDNYAEQVKQWGKTDVDTALQSLESGGNLYKVDLPDEQIAKMLDWDKPLSEQPEVFSKLNPQVIKDPESYGAHKWLLTVDLPNSPNRSVDAFKTKREALEYMNMINGERLYDSIAVGRGPKNTSNTLMGMDIPGIRYLDQASRGAGEGTSNYVVFSDEIPQILERNGQPIAQALREYKPQFPEGMLGKTEMFETGTPASFEFIRNTEKSPYMGEKFGQDIEPAGRYLSYKDPVVDMSTMPSTWESGSVSFNNPLVVNFGESYGTPTNWKNMLSKSFGGKTGKDLSKAIAESGYDGIVTVDKYGTSEIVDLSNFLGKEK